MVSRATVPHNFCNAACSSCPRRSAAIPGSGRIKRRTARRTSAYAETDTDSALEAPRAGRQWLFTSPPRGTDSVLKRSSMPLAMDTNGRQMEAASMEECESGQPTRPIADLEATRGLRTRCGERQYQFVCAGAPRRNQCRASPNRPLALASGTARGEVGGEGLNGSGCTGCGKASAM